MLNKEFGGQVSRKDNREDGQLDITVDDSCILFKSVSLLTLFSIICFMNSRSVVFIHFIRRNLGKKQQVLLTHGDCIEKVADSFREVARSGSFIVGIANEKLRLYGLQFHPEVSLLLPKSNIMESHSAKL